jgi:hypothetical protein
MNLDEFRRRRRALTRVPVAPADVWAELNAATFDHIAAEAMPDVLALLDVDLTMARINWEAP